MITLTGLGYAYPGEEAVLESVSLEIGRGALIGLVGANGSGKSTLMALVAGLYTPTEGSLVVDGFGNPGQGKSVRAVCRLVMQDADLQILGATVEEDLLLGRKRSEETVHRARKLADRFNLLEAWERPVHTLSWGMKRKLCLAAALLDEPRVLLLDEPFSGLDYPAMREMRRLLAENREAGLTQIVSSHDLECFVDMVDQLAVLDSGRLVLAGPPHSVMGDMRAHGVRPPCSWNAGQGIMPWEDDAQ
jgi:biotin transport system ATP-binding protein